MKKIIFLLTVLYGSVSAQKYSCCAVSSVNHQNSLLAMNESFAKTHITPEPFRLENQKGEMISFKTSDGKEGKAYFIKSPKPTERVLFVFHEWWGLNDYIKREAETLQSELGDVNVYALDLYDGKVATTVPDAQKYMGEMKEERSKAIINAAIQLAGKNAKIASIGWCLGGAWSLQAALLEGKQAVGCVMYYGMPEENVDRLKTLNCDVFGVFALRDGHITPAIVKTFQENMDKAGKKLALRSYEAEHAFANPSNPKFDKVSADDAREKVLAYLKARLFQ